MIDSARRHTQREIAEREGYQVVSCGHTDSREIRQYAEDNTCRLVVDPLRVGKVLVVKDLK